MNSNAPIKCDVCRTVSWIFHVDDTTGKLNGGKTCQVCYLRKQTDDLCSDVASRDIRIAELEDRLYAASPIQQAMNHGHA